MRGGLGPRPPVGRPLWSLSSLRRGACAALLALLLAPAGAQTASWAAGPAAAEGPASPLVRSAQGLAAAGKWAEASALLAEAEEADGRDADARYLSALALLKSKDDAAAALGELEVALLSGRFFLYAPADAAALKASLLIRTRRYAEALDLVSPRAGESLAAYGAERRLAAAQALFGLGRREAAFAELSEGARLFPAEPRFARLFFTEATRARGSNAAPEPPETNAIRDLGDLFLRRLPSLADYDPELRVLAAPLIRDEGARRDSVLAFRSMGGSSAEASLLALEYGIIDDSKCVAELLSRPSLLRSDLDALRGLIRDAKGMAALEAALSSFSGTLETDGDGDGWAEGKAVFEKGSLESYSLDADQDGRPELLVVAKEGLPTSLSLRRAGLSLELSFSSYPYVETLDFLPADEAREYRFGPEAYIYKPLELLAFPSADADSLYLPEPTGAPDPTERSAAAAALSLAAMKGEYRDLVSLDRGVPLRRERFLGGRLYAVLDYQAGRPGREEVDADGDGRFETERRYDPEGDGSDASIRSVLIDADGDGIYEYSEETAFPQLKEWDFDADGRADARQTRLSGGGSRREFSSRLDGNFDEVLVLDAKGKILSFERGGRALRLIADSNPRLRWIGRKPFDLGGNLPPAEGLYRYKNTRYRLVYAGDDAFAELIP